MIVRHVSGDVKDLLADFTQRHLDRARAEVFGAVAEEYDLHRPAFPDALIDDLTKLGTHVLDVGCGTGKVARALAERSVEVLGVEVDSRMAAVARGHGVCVEVAPFETWDDGGRRFDLIASGDAWHWIEPKQGAAKAALVLRPGGWLVRFWNVQVLPDSVTQALDAVYRQHAPEVFVYGHAPPVVEDPNPLPLGPPFRAAEMKTYLSERRVDGAEWAAFTGTISDHKRLPPERLAVLQAAIRAAIEGFGETVLVRMATTALFARLEADM
jgi:SAM-dependent methyltransferase